MMRMNVTKIFEFSAAHKLPHYDGDCRNLHGHTYRLEVTFSGSPMTEGSNQGMIIDFNDLKTIVEEYIIKRLDHRYLNEVFFNPTAELMVDWIWRELDVGLLRSYAVDGTDVSNDIRLEKVRLWESPGKSYVEIIRTGK